MSGKNVQFTTEDWNFLCVRPRASCTLPLQPRAWVLDTGKEASPTHTIGPRGVLCPDLFCAHLFLKKQLCLVTQ